MRGVARSRRRQRTHDRPDRRRTIRSMHRTRGQLRVRKGFSAAVLPGRKDQTYGVRFVRGCTGRHQGMERPATQVALEGVGMSPGRALDEPPIQTAAQSLTAAELLERDSRYCSYGDTVHYADPPKIFARCDGSYLFDQGGTPYLDLQMWYSAVNFGYKNR